MIEMRCNLTFGSFNVTSTGISVTGYQQYHQWHHCIPQIKKNQINDTWIYASCDIIHFGMPWCQWHCHGTSGFLTSRRSKWGAIWPLFGHMIPMALAPSLAPLQSWGQDDWNKVQHELFWSCDATGAGVCAMWCHCWSHKMSTAWSVATLHSLGLNNEMT